MLVSCWAFPCRSIISAMVIGLAGPVAQKLFFASFCQVSAPPLPANVQPVSSMDVAVESGGKCGLVQNCEKPGVASADSAEGVSTGAPPPGDAVFISIAIARGANGATRRANVCCEFVLVAMSAS